MNYPIISRCVYDVDNRYVDINIRRVSFGGAFILTVSDTSDEEQFDAEIELYLSREDLKKVIDRLTEVLQNE